MSFLLRGARGLHAAQVASRAHAPPVASQYAARVASVEVVKKNVKGGTSSMLDRLELCVNLQKSDGFVADFVDRCGATLLPLLGNPADRLAPLFHELMSTKDMHSMYVERRISLKTQEMLASHAEEHLRDSIDALDQQLQTQQPEVLNYFERLGFGPARLDSRSARWLKGRYKGQIEELMEEQSLAKAILGSIEPATGPASRVIEVAMAAKEEELEKELSWVIRSLRQMEANMAEAKARLEEGDFAEEASLPYELVAARGM